MREWLLSLPCVLNEQVTIDTRGPWPVAIIGVKAITVECKDDMINFVMVNL